MDTPPRQLRSGKRKGVTPLSPEQDPSTPRPAAAGVVGRGPSNAESSTTPRRLRHRANINIFPDITGNERVELAFFASSPPPEIHLATPRTTEAPVYHLSSQTPDLPKPSAEPLLLRDLLYIPPPVAPPIYDKYKLTSTRGMTVDDISLPEDLQLKTIVPVHSLLEPIIKFAEGQIEGKYIHPDQWEELSWLSRIHPAVTSSSLPSIIHSEKDSEAWCLNVLFRPSLTVACAVFEDSFVVPEKNPEFDDFPNLTSAHGAGKEASIPDVML
ncbi:hypothetical protein B0H10DRAFT_639706 [Mycena sp. CBHHK59/15]|nr:hypothetical protein B0H10DRAFT_639706 [Mycena sp. CBHHK59/15]